MKNKIVKLMSSLLLVSIGVVALGSCGPGDSLSSSTPSELVSSPYSVDINIIGSGEIAVSKTVQLRSTVIGTNEKDVTWSSTDNSIATVSDRGLVTGVGAGTVKVRATLILDSNAFGEVTITVLPALTPTALTITGAQSGIAWVNENVNLFVTATPSEASSLVTWESSDEAVAAVSESGAVSFLTAGNVVIKATSTADTKISAHLTFEVKLGTFYSNKGSANWQLANQADPVNPRIELPGASSSGYNSAYFNHYQGQRFYIEATFKTGALTGDAWAWQGIGVGTGLSDSDSRFFTFSPFAPNQGNTHNKTILRDMPTTWGALTDRSQVWGEHGLNQIDSNDGVKIAMLRDNNRYYYLVNDQLHWVDDTNKYDEINTYPVIVGFDMAVTVSDYHLVSDPSALDAKISSVEYGKSFFTSGNNVTYIDDSDFTFNSLTTMSKDHKVRSLGDQTKVFGEFEISFDLENMTFNQESESFTGLSVNFIRYDNANVNESLLIGQSHINEDKEAIVGRFQSWDYTKSMNDPTGMIKYAESSETVKTNAFTKSTITIKRVIIDQKAIFEMKVDGVPVEFDIGSAANVEAAVYYTGAYLIWIGGEYTSVSVSDFVYTSH